jgi:hypothetical protein
MPHPLCGTELTLARAAPRGHRKGSRGHPEFFPPPPQKHAHRTAMPDHLPHPHTRPSRLTSRRHTTNPPRPRHTRPSRLTSRRHTTHPPRPRHTRPSRLTSRRHTTNPPGPTSRTSPSHQAVTADLTPAHSQSPRTHFQDVTVTPGHRGSPHASAQPIPPDRVTPGRRG